MDTRTALLVLASAFIAGIVRALKNDLTAFPTLSTPIRGALAIIGGAIAAGVDAAQQKSAPFITTTLIALATSAPTLVALVVEAWGHHGTGAGGADASAPKPQSPTTADLQGGQHPIRARRLGALALVSMLAMTGCGSIPQIVQTAQTATTVVQTVLNVLSQLVASYYAVKPNPTQEQHLHDLLADVASADAALQRATSGTDRELGGDIATAYANLDKAYSDLMVALVDAGVLKKALGAGGSGYAIAFGKHDGEAVPPLPKLKGAS